MDWGNICKTVVAIGGAITTYLYGGWTSILGVLVAFVVIDYITGLMAGAVGEGLSSAVGFKGIAKKICLFAVVAVGHLVDTAIGQGNIIRDAAIFFYMANELISILENCGRLGLPVPKILQDAGTVLKKKGE
ncbi:phage holin family protein [Desulforamulus ruminis]|uniref:Toxin secretion/phage lysis holin n=1 Tax=Desulforamulus ruminis (strain ATCC 23193 / DSM 2154 / NCIMB 8452 / DL) TaxID=696281 RepID=F6DM37_DESRL|nr:phage holin family protein [Desulforamulus ruminis]AEG59379.1 toxin secretion/phage lysis holin [Desulforamulus ruminis DSM 2154]